MYFPSTNFLKLLRIAFRPARCISSGFNFSGSNVSVIRTPFGSRANFTLKHNRQKPEQSESSTTGNG